jgi:hypothetical protein
MLRSLINGRVRIEEAKMSLPENSSWNTRLVERRVPRSFFRHDVNKRDWNAEPGDFAILIGISSAKIELKGLFTLSR